MIVITAEKAAISVFDRVPHGRVAKDGF